MDSCPYRFTIYLKEASFNAFAKADPDQAALVRAVWSGSSLFDYGNILFDLILYVPSTIFQLNRDGSSWVEPVLSWDKCVLLKDYNSVTPMRLEPAASLSRVKLSTTEPLRSLLMEIWWDMILHKWTWQVISLFYVQTWKFIYIIIHSGWSLAWIFMKERVKGALQYMRWDGPYTL